MKLSPTATKFALSPTLAANIIAKDRRAQGLKVLHMGFGESPFPVPPMMQQALEGAVHRKDYLPCAGDAELCDAVARYYEKTSGIDASKYDVVVAPGSKLILYSLQMALQGDLLMPVPSWVSYAPQALMLHTKMIKVPTKLDDVDGGYHIDAQQLRAIIHKSRAEGKNPSKLILNYPNNPTGLTIPDAELKAIAEVCVEENILIISDEIYGKVNFNSNYQSIARYAPTHTAVSTGLSKHLSLGGWRLGVGFVPKSISGLHGLIANIASETWSCVPSPISQAAVKAFEGHKEIEDHVEQCTAIHSHMNKYIAEGLRSVGVKAPCPAGAFYNYPDFDPVRSGLAKLGVATSEDLAGKLAKDYGLISLPGVAFGADPEVLTLRLSGCDYDGAKALSAVQSGVPLDDSFIPTYAPNLVDEVNAFGDLVAKAKAA